MVSVNSEKPTCARYYLTISPMLLLKTFQCSSDWQWPFQGRSSSASSLYIYLLQVINGLMTFILCLQVMSQKASDLLRCKAFVMVTLCITVYFAQSFPLSPECPGLCIYKKALTGVYPVNTVIPVHCSEVVSASRCCCCCCHELCGIFIKYITIYHLLEGHHFVAYLKDCHSARTFTLKLQHNKLRHWIRI